MDIFSPVPNAFLCTQTFNVEKIRNYLFVFRSKDPVKYMDERLLRGKYFEWKCRKSLPVVSYLTGTLSNGIVSASSKSSNEFG